MSVSTLCDYATTLLQREKRVVCRRPASWFPTRRPTSAASQAPLTVRAPGSEETALGAQHTCSAVETDSWPSLPNLRRSQATGYFTVCSHKSSLKPGGCTGRRKEQAAKPVNGKRATLRWHGSEGVPRRRASTPHADSASIFRHQDGFYYKQWNNNRLSRGSRKSTRFPAPQPVYLKTADWDRGSKGPSEAVPFPSDQQRGADKPWVGGRARPAPESGHGALLFKLLG